MEQGFIECHREGASENMQHPKHHSRTIPFSLRFKQGLLFNELHKYVRSMHQHAWHVEAPRL